MSPVQRPLIPHNLCYLCPLNIGCPRSNRPQCRLSSAEAEKRLWHTQCTKSSEYLKRVVHSESSEDYAPKSYDFATTSGNSPENSEVLACFFHSATFSHPNAFFKPHPKKINPQSSSFKHHRRCIDEQYVHKHFLTQSWMRAEEIPEFLQQEQAIPPKPSSTTSVGVQGFRGHVSESRSASSAHSPPTHNVRSPSPPEPKSRRIFTEQEPMACGVALSDVPVRRDIRLMSLPRTPVPRRLYSYIHLLLPSSLSYDFPCTNDLLHPVISLLFILSSGIKVCVQHPAPYRAYRVSTWISAGAEPHNYYSTPKSSTLFLPPRLLFQCHLIQHIYSYFRVLFILLFYFSNPAQPSQWAPPVRMTPHRLHPLLLTLLFLLELVNALLSRTNLTKLSKTSTLTTTSSKF